jgi:DNA-binding IclR family transcriptional regulator
MTPRRVQRRRARPRLRDPLPLDKALEIIELLAKHPGGLNVPEIAARVDAPTGSVIRVIAVLQRRQWLRVAPPDEGISLGPRVTAMKKQEDGDAVDGALK